MRAAGRGCLMTPLGDFSHALPYLLHSSPMPDWVAVGDRLHSRIRTRRPCDGLPDSARGCHRACSGRSDWRVAGPYISVRVPMTALAQSGHPNALIGCPLSGVERTCGQARQK